MSTDAIIRIVAAVAAVALAGAPAATWLVAKVRNWKASPATPAEAAAVGLREMRIVLDLADRLRVVGCTEGVGLCQQLLDVMLGGCPGKTQK